MLSTLSLGEENARGIIDIAVVIGIVVGVVGLVVVSVVVGVVIISLQTGKQICIDWLFLGNIFSIFFITREILMSEYHSSFIHNL